MKVNFTTTAEFVPEFNGNRELPEAEQIKMKLTSLEMGENLHLVATLQAATGKTQVEKGDLDVDRQLALIKACGTYIPGHVSEITGNENFTVADIVKWMPFAPLAAEILFQLVEISSPNEVDVKNLKPQPV